MALPQGIDFRATSGFVTDPANCTKLDSSNAYPVSTPQGNTVGWSGVLGGHLDADAGIDPRIAGAVYTSSNTATFEIDLPAPGTYSVSVGCADARGNGYPLAIQIADNGSVLLSVTGTTTPTNFCMDLAGNITNAATWATNNPQGGGGAGAKSLTFASTVFQFLLNSPIQGSNFNVVSYIWVQSAGAPPSAPNNIYFDTIF